MLLDNFLFCVSNLFALLFEGEEDEDEGDHGIGQANKKEEMDLDSKDHIKGQS